MSNFDWKKYVSLLAAILSGAVVAYIGTLYGAPFERGFWIGLFCSFWFMVWDRTKPAADRADAYREGMRA